MSEAMLVWWLVIATGTGTVTIPVPYTEKDMCITVSQAINEDGDATTAICIPQANQDVLSFHHIYNNHIDPYAQ